MVDWDRVQELRSKGWEWDDIADDPKVGFHPDSSVKETGRALRALYHRQRSQRERQGPAPTPSKRRDPTTEQRWTLIRVLYLLVPLVGIWAIFAYLAPSPVGLLVPAIPWLALALAVLAFVLIYLLLRADRRWTKVYRSTVIGGVVVGIVFAGMVGLVGALVFGCPFLPPASALTAQPQGWASGTMAPWHQDGKPVLFYYGATWCPYCSASSWALYKALISFGQLTGQQFQYSSPNDVYPQTPEVNLANAQLNSQYISLLVVEDDSGNDGSFPATTTCFQSAYVAAYSGGAIPFVVINGQYVHGGASLLNPADFTSWASTGVSTVQQSVQSESAGPWTSVPNLQAQSWVVMALLVKSCGLSVSVLASQYHWTSATSAGVTNALASIK
jgi:thiol-disulfide isomerase/thioredoxin